MYNGETKRRGLLRLREVCWGDGALHALQEAACSLAAPREGAAQADALTFLWLVHRQQHVLRKFGCGSTLPNLTFRVVEVYKEEGAWIKAHLAVDRDVTARVGKARSRQASTSQPDFTCRLLVGICPSLGSSFELVSLDSGPCLRIPFLWI